MTRPTLSCLGFAALIIAVMLLDQLSKWAVWDFLTFGEVEPAPFLDWLTALPQERTVWPRYGVNEFFNLVTIWNQGVSFGIFSQDHAAGPYILSALALGISGVLGVWMIKDKRLTLRIPLSLIIAGALSNVWDRMRFGAVADFLDFHYKGWHYPAFNLADSCIVLGVALLAFHTLFLERKKRTA